MTPENPDYNLLIAVYVSLVILYFCVQELLVTYLFTSKDLEEMKKNKEENQGLRD